MFEEGRMIMEETMDGAATVPCGKVGVTYGSGGCPGEGAGSAGPLAAGGEEHCGGAPCGSSVADRRADRDRRLRWAAFSVGVLVQAAQAACLAAGAAAGDPWSFVEGAKLAFGVPMTVHIYRIAKGQASNATAFDVLSIFLVSPISGILLLLSGRDGRPIR